MGGGGSSTWRVNLRNRQMGKKDNSAIRVAVGPREGPKSGVWRIWPGKNKSDVYVAVRSYAGIFKVSLHESGDCYVGLTTQFAAHNSPG